MPEKSWSHAELRDGIRAAFISYRRKKQPFYRGGEQLEAVLDAAARNCAAVKLDPATYVQSIYLAYVGDHDGFWPNTLSGQRALRVAEKHGAEYAKIKPEMYWNTQLGILKQCIDRTPRKVVDILFDEAMAFSPWFRIVVTKSAEPTIIKKYGPAAKQALDEDLLTFLKAKTPSQLDRIQNYERYL